MRGRIPKRRGNKWVGLRHAPNKGGGKLEQALEKAKAELALASSDKAKGGE